MHSGRESEGAGCPSQGSQGEEVVLPSVVHVPICLSIMYVSMCVSMYLQMCESVIYPSMPTSIHPYIHPSLHLSL